MIERSTVQWGTTTIPYAVRRSARRATVSIAVDPSEGVLLTAPAATPIVRLDGVVRSKARWIVERLRQRAELPAPLAEREFTSGETFLYLGRQYRLKLLLDDAVRPLRLHGGWLELPLPVGLDEAHRPEYARAALTDWYRRRALSRLPERVSLWSQRLAMTPSAVVVRDQQKRWASCDARGVVRFNWRVIQAPLSLVDYVVAHELVHLAHEHHGREFWALLGRVMPDYEARQERLRRLGRGLEW